VFGRATIRLGIGPHSSLCYIAVINCLLCPVSSSRFFHRLISAVGDWMSTILAHIGLSANLECMSEMCCTRLAENTRRKK